jgi:hypothetical protein
LGSEAPSFFETDPVYGRALAFYPSNRERPLIAAVIVTVLIGTVLNFTLAAESIKVDLGQICKACDAGLSLPSTVSAGDIATMLITAGVVLAFGWYLVGIWNREVVLYERGFSYREGSRVVFFRYAEIASIRQRAQRLAYFGGLFRRTVYRFTIKTLADETIVLNNVYKRVAELGVNLEQKITDVRRPMIEYALRQGETVHFSDDLALTQLGLRANDGRSLAWEQFGGYRAQRGQLIILDASGAEWLSIPLESLENLALLLEQFKAHRKESAAT